MCVPVPGGIRQPGISCQGVIRLTPLILGALVGLAYLRFPERIVRISGTGYALRRDEIIANSDKGEVGGSSPPRPTIKIINKYAAIHVFPSKGELSSKTILPKICQNFA